MEGQKVFWRWLPVVLLRGCGMCEKKAGGDLMQAAVRQLSLRGISGTVLGARAKWLTTDHRQAFSYTALLFRFCIGGGSPPLAYFYKLILKVS